MPTRFGSAMPLRTRKSHAGLDVAHAVDPQRAVVEVHEPLAEARRAAHVGREDGDAAREQRLVGRVERRALLAFGAAVEVEHVGGERATRARGTPAGRYSHPAELDAVVGTEAHQLRAHGGGEVDPRRRAVRHARDRTGRPVEHVDVRRRRCARSGPREAAAVLRERYARHQLRRHAAHRRPPSGRRVEQLQLTPAGDVPDERSGATIVGERESLQFRVVAPGDGLQGAGRAVRRKPHAREGEPVGVAVGGEPHRARVGEEPAVELRAVGVRGEALFATRPEIAQPEVVVAPALQTVDDDPRTVVRHVGRATDAARPADRRGRARREVRTRRLASRRGSHGSSRGTTSGHRGPTRSTGCCSSRRV